MKSKKMISVLLVVLIGMTVLYAGMISSHAETFFDEGDFRFAVTSGDRVMVAGYYGDSTELTLPDSVVGRAVIGVYSRCFENSAVQSVVIPEGYSSIGSFAFSGCAGLTSIELPSSLRSIGIMAFFGCQALGNVDFSNTALEKISFASFQGCSSLTVMSLPDTVTSLGDNAFCNCTSLETLRLSESLTAVPEYAFYNCALTELRIPESVQSIGTCAFGNDLSLGGVFVPDSVTSIGTGAFSPMLDSAAFEARCYEGSYAEEYFTENNAVNFAAYAKILGDVNVDGVLNVVDVTAIQKHCAGLITLEGQTVLELADVNHDERIDVTDATAVQRIIAGLEAA